MSDDREITSRVSRAGPGTLVDVLFELKRLTRAMLGDPLDPSAPLGLIQRQNVQEVHLADLEKRTLVLEDDVPKRHGRLAEWENWKDDVRGLLAREEASRTKLEDRTATRIAQALALLAGSLLATLGAIYSKGGNHP